MLNSIIVKYVVTIRHFSDSCTSTFDSELKVAKLVLDDLHAIQEFFMMPEQLDMLKKGRYPNPN